MLLDIQAGFTSCCHGNWQLVCCNGNYGLVTIVARIYSCNGYRLQVRLHTTRFSWRDCQHWMLPRWLMHRFVQCCHGNRLIQL